MGNVINLRTHAGYNGNQPQGRRRGARRFFLTYIGAGERAARRRPYGPLSLDPPKPVLFSQAINGSMSSLSGSPIRGAVSEAD